MPRTFAVTFDYLCPFARNASEHVITGLRDGADWDVTFVPYSLSQGHVPDGEVAVWDRDEPDVKSGVLAFQFGLAVRDNFPEYFLDVHEGIFAARHDHDRNLKDPTVLRDVVDAAGIDGDRVLDLVATRQPLRTLRDEHLDAVERHSVWGVPTFITAARAVFVRIMDRPHADAAVARARIEQIVELVDSPLELHEFKQTVLAR